MELPFGIFISGIESFLLIFVRVTGMFVIAPIFSQKNMPSYMKIGFCFLIALILVNVVPGPGMSMTQGTLLGYMLIVIKEFVTGIIIGYVAYLVFSAIYLAGEIIDMQIGFGVVNVFDPFNNIQAPISSNFYFLLCMVIFLLLDGHHLLIKAIYESFSRIPLGQPIFGAVLLDDMTSMLGNIFLLGFKISAPILASMLIIDVALGVIMKTLPQLNIFVVGMPLKILAGLLVLWVVVPVFAIFVNMMINGMNSELYKFMEHMVQK